MISPLWGVTSFSIIGKRMTRGTSAGLLTRRCAACAGNRRTGGAVGQRSDARTRAIPHEFQTAGRVKTRAGVQ